VLRTGYPPTMRWRKKQPDEQAVGHDAIWNRAAMERGGAEPRQGDAALASLLRLHNAAMSSGLLHAVTEGLTRGEFDAALNGYRYFGLAEAAVVAESVMTDAAHASDEELEALEGEADRRYGSVVPDDATLFRAFVTKLQADKEAFAPSGN
jgi:hypothetical protein